MPLRMLLNGEIHEYELGANYQSLAQYLRSIGLTGTKIACEQGGCGACTVIVSDWRDEQWQHRSVNACLFPLASADGKAITSIEALGSVQTSIDPIQERLAEYGGTQCGFCTSGFVMRMLELKQKSPLLMADVEAGFDGNICRCTGYRPILHAFRSFAADFHEEAPQIKGEALSHEKPAKLSAYAFPLTPAPEKQSQLASNWHRPRNMAAFRQLLAHAEKPRFLLGNTSTAFAPISENTIIELSELAELREIKRSGDCLEIGGAVRIQELIDYLEGEEAPSLRLLRKALSRLGNQQIRNVAGLAGNIMLSLKRAREGGIPIVSDVFTPLYALDAEALLWHKGHEIRTALHDIPEDAFILAFQLPIAHESMDYYRLARRSQNSRAIINAAFRMRLSSTGIIESFRAVYGGIDPLPKTYPALENLLLGRHWSDYPIAKDLLANESIGYASDENISAEYRIGLLYSFLEKFMFQQDAPSHTISKAQQHFHSVYSTIGKPILKPGAFLQTTGEAKYTQDIELPRDGLHAAFVVSENAHAEFAFNPDELYRAFPEIHGVVTAADIPGIRYIGLGNDEPVFAEKVVTSFGQAIALVLADEEAIARRAAKYAQKLIHYEELPAVLSFDEAIANKAFMPDLPFMPSLRHLQRDDEPQQTPIHSLSGSQSTGAQAHFYMETQSILAIPDEQRLKIYASTQDVYSIQWRIAQVLKRSYADIEVITRRIGGGFGAKETRPPFIAAAAALAANKFKKPVRLVLDRQTDSRMIGKRHPFRGDYAIKLSDSGMLEQSSKLYADAGDSYDVSLLVMDLALFTYDNAYYVPTYRVDGEAVRSNKASNTAMRSFGVVQAHLIQENIWEHAAFELKMRPDALRRQHLYRANQRTPANELLVEDKLIEIWDKLYNDADFEERWQAVQVFNASNAHRKRGISMLPLRYGIGYTTPFLNQASALVNVYAGDGTVQIFHGGVEMGQGIHIKMMQVASDTLGLPIEKFRIGDMNSSVIPNASSTGASTGTDLNGTAIHKACQKLLKRLQAFGKRLRLEWGDARASELGIDFWNYTESWAAKVETNGESKLIWDNLVLQAYFHGINLSSQANFRHPMLKDKLSKGETPFFYFNYAAAISEVEIDTSTGEHIVRRSDILYDAAQSINPIIDIGQIEGGFVQGLGYVTAEEVLFDAEGKLISDNFWTYKVPSSRCIPQDFRVSLYQNDTLQRIGMAQSNMGVKSSKSTGEPPLVLANTVFFAIKAAILAARQSKGFMDWFEMPAPATVESIYRYCNPR